MSPLGRTTFSCHSSRKSSGICFFLLCTSGFVYFCQFFLVELLTPIRLDVDCWWVTNSLFGSMYNGIVLQDPCRKSLSAWRKRFSSNIAPFLAPFILRSSLTGFPVQADKWKKAFPQHNATTIMLHWRNGVFWVMSSVGFPPNVALCANARIWNFGFSDQGTFFHFS